jgi:hypothetical protein
VKAATSSDAWDEDGNLTNPDEEEYQRLEKLRARSRTSQPSTPDVDNQPRNNQDEEG